jgi:translocator protein
LICAPGIVASFAFLVLPANVAANPAINGAAQGKERRVQADVASRRRRGRAIASWTTYGLASAAAGAAAVVGAWAVDPGSSWYRGLAKPSWQPPPRAFGLVWTPLYASIAWAGGHALRRTRGRQRNALAASLATNLAVNTAWNWMFFGLRSPRTGLAGTLLLDLSNAELIRRMARIDPRAAAALVPYALWCAFATILNADIARRNRRDPVRAG